MIGPVIVVEDVLKTDKFANSNSDVFVYMSIGELMSDLSSIIVSSKVKNSVSSPFVAGIILSEQSQNIAKPLLEKCKKLFPWFDSSMIISTSRIDQNVLDYAVRLIAHLSKYILRHAKASESENAELRTLYEKAQAALFEIENSHRKPYRAQLLLQYLPVNIIGKAPSLPITMRLKQEYKALHAIDLYFEQNHNAFSNTDFVIELIGAQSGRKLAMWRARESRLRAGWNRFYCPVFEEPIGECVAIRASAESSVTRFTLRCGERQTNQDCVSVTPHNQDPAAVRLWSGLPGVKLPRTQAGFSVNDLELTDPRALSGPELLQLASATVRKQSPSVTWREESNALLVHPAGVDPVVACIAALQVTDLSAVTVSCKLDHPDAAITEFAAWIVRPNDTISVESPAPRRLGHSRFRLFGDRKSGGGNEVVPVPSGVSWLTLTGGQEGELSFAVDPTYTGAIDLFLATRNRSPGNHYAWAVFTDVRFEIATSHFGTAHVAP